jgi:hypothetical protein
MRPIKTSRTPHLVGRSGLVLLALFGALACKDEDEVCALLPQRGVELTVVDAVSGANLEALASVTATRLLPRDIPKSGPPEFVWSMTAIAGTYELRIVATGYVSRTDTVTVASRLVRGCEETLTVTRTVQLTPQP